MNINELRDAVSALQEEIRSLTEVDDISEDDDARLDAALAEFETRQGELAAAEARQARVDAARAAEVARHSGDGGPQIMRRVEPEALDVRRALPGELRDAALKILERDGDGLAARQADHVDRLLRTRSGLVDGPAIARRMMLTETDAYRSAFVKGVTQTSPAFTDDEARALNEFRAASIGTDASGGFGVPVLIDPTIILTSGAADAPVLSVARIETITNDEWKGVSSAGVSWSFDAEAAAVSDDTPTLAQPVVTTHMARGFIPYSIEVGMDYPGFAAEMRALLDQGYVNLLATATVTGSGSGQPYGIFTAIDATAASEVTPTTDGAFGAVDILKAWKTLPERYRSRASWLMHVDVENEVRTFAASSDGAYYTVNLAAGGIGNLMGRPILVTDYAPEFTGTTGASNILIVGDFSNYLVAQRAGMTVELVPHLFDVTDNRPTGQRGWFAWARVGADSVNDRGFILLQNQ